MKYILTCFLCGLAILGFSQSPDGIVKDTTLANQYLTTAQQTYPPDSLSLELLHKAIKIYEEHEYFERLIISKGLLAYFSLMLKIDKDVRHTIEENFQLVEENYGMEDHPTLLYSYMALQFFYSRSDAAKAIDYGQKALEVVNKTDERYFRIAFLLIADYCYNLQSEDAIQMLDKIEKRLEENEEAPDPALATQVLRAHLQIKLEQRNFESALIYGQKCLAENQLHQVYDIRELGTIYIEMGICYLELGHFDEAIDWMENGLKITDLPADDPILGSYYVNVAYAYSAKQDNKTAIEYNQKAIALFTNHEQQYGQMLMSTLYNTSVFYYKLGDLENAAKCIEDSYQYGQHCALYMHHANILSEMEKYPDALKYIQKSLIMLSADFDAEDIEQNPGKHATYGDPYWAGLTLTNKATILSKWGINERSSKYLLMAREVCEMAVQVHADFSRQLQGYEMAKMTYNESIYRTLQNLARTNQVLFELNQDKTFLHAYFQTTERLKAMMLLQTLTPNPLPEDIARKEEGLVSALRLLEQKLESAREDSLVFFQNQLFEANRTYETFVEQLRKDFPKETSAFYNLDYANIPDVQSGLEEGELYLDYTFNSNSLYILSISKEGGDLTKVEIDGQFLEGLSTMQKLLKDPLLVQRPKREYFVETSNLLYGYLILPIEERLIGKSKILVSPESQLFYLPFEVLLANDEVRSFEELDFLVKKHQFSYQYSATIYQQLKDKPAIKDFSLLAFAPVFENEEGAVIAVRHNVEFGDTLLRSIEDGHFIPLPNSKKEVSKIAEIVSSNGRAKVLLGHQATNVNLKKAMEASAYQFIHIATHGMVNLQNPKLSALACYQTQEDEEELFYASEIQLQNIQADLVVLSSCESGIGQLIAGEGLLALGRSFIYAGAKNVLFSLWKVNDQYTSELMVDFYKKYFEKNDYSGALRQAKLKMIADPVTANPRYWAPFVLMGE